MEEDPLERVIEACRLLIRDRFDGDGDHGAAAMLLDDGTVLTGTSPNAVNPAVELCHEVEPLCAAFRLGRNVVASACLHRAQGGRTVVLSPCGVCRERLAVYGPDVAVAVAGSDDPAVAVWKTLGELLPDYWLAAFPEEIDSAWDT
jgi:cytidine deaminase